MTLERFLRQRAADTSRRRRFAVRQRRGCLARRRVCERAANATLRGPRQSQL